MNPPQKKQDKTQKFPPYIFALSLLALAGKFAYSLRQQEALFDRLMIIFIIVFAFSGILFALSTYSNRSRSKISARVNTGSVDDSSVTGASVRESADADVEITAKSVKKSKIIGYKEGDKD